MKNKIIVVILSLIILSGIAFAVTLNAIEVDKGTKDKLAEKGMASIVKGDVMCGSRYCSVQVNNTNGKYLFTVTIEKFGYQFNKNKQIIKVDYTTEEINQVIDSFIAKRLSLIANEETPTKTAPIKVADGGSVAIKEKPKPIGGIGTGTTNDDSFLGGILKWLGL